MELVSGGVTIDDGAMVFDGVNGVVNTNSPSSIDSINEFSFGVWIYSGDYTENGYIISKRDGYNEGWILQYKEIVNDFKFTIENSSGTNVFVETHQNVNSSQWYFLSWYI